MDFSSVIQMLIPVGVNILGGMASSIVAGTLFKNISGGKKQLLVIGLCLGASIGNMFLTGQFSDVALDFSTTEATFSSVGALFVLMASAWTASQAYYFKVIKKD